LETEKREREGAGKAETQPFSKNPTRKFKKEVQSVGSRDLAKYLNEIDDIPFSISA
jgi:hypothetical protein